MIQELLMSSIRPIATAFLLLLWFEGIVCCGGGSMQQPLRQLQSITISPASTSVPSGSQAHFTATGNFNQPPNPVTPLDVIWKVTALNPSAPGCPLKGVCINDGQTLCNGYTGVATIQATAPADPNIPLNSINGDPSIPIIIGTAQLNCT